jgi:DNA-3-methyladenine glycosylase
MKPLARLDVEGLGIPRRRAGRKFFRRETREVARDLLGAWFLRRMGARVYGARIVEVEAYLGSRDAAAHSFAGRRTQRVEPMYGDGGLLYVFQVYGMYFCANVVTRGPGQAEAVLIRAAFHPRAGARDLAGPGKFCLALGIERRHSGADLVGAGEFEIRPAPVSRRSIVTSARIGVDYAGEARHWPLRFSIRGEPAVSRPVSRSA